MSILVIAEHDNKTLNGATLNVVAAAQKSVVILLYWLQALVLRLLQTRQQKLRVSAKFFLQTTPCTNTNWLKTLHSLWLM